MGFEHMKKIKKTILLVLLLFSLSEVYSQTKTTIRGKVIDEKDKLTIIGATIVELGKDNRVINGAITDLDGNFVYQMKDPLNTVKISMIGYTTKVFKPNFNKVVVIELTNSATKLDQINIVAKAKSNNNLTNVDERDNASSRVKVDLMSMSDVGITSASDALQGKVTGLDIISASGDPGSGSQIVIRGLSSMGNSKPLIVVDGIPQDNVPSSVDLSSANTEDISNMINVTLQDIKSIEVLKDAASSAIYGSRGADGVLLIETYRGKMGHVKFDYQYKNSINFQPPAIPMLNGDEYVILQLEEWLNATGVYKVPQEIAFDPDYEDFYNYSANTDWLKEITQNSVTNDHYFKVSGGGEKTRYYTSFGIINEGGTTINTGSKKLSTRVNFDYFLSQKLMFSIQFSYYNNQIDKSHKVRDRNVREMAYIKSPNMSVWEYDSNGNLTGEYFTPIHSYQGNGYEYFNPVAVAELGTRTTNTNSLKNSFRLKYTIKDWLIFRETLAFQYNGSKSNAFLPYNAIGVDWLNSKVNSASESNDTYSSIKTESTLIFDVPFNTKNHVLSGTAAWITNQSNRVWTYIGGNRTPTTIIKDPAIDSQIGWIGSGMTEKRDFGALMSLNYKMKDRYMLQTVLRADANSAFGVNNRWGKFYGISGAWRFSDEPLFDAWANWLGDSKLKMSWGVTGSPPGNAYARFALYNSTYAGSYITNPAIVPTSIQLDQLKWETVTASNIGLEFNLFKDKLFILGEVYRSQTSDILFEKYDIPYASGFNQLRYLNSGAMENKGWELMVNYKILRTKDWFIGIDVNVSKNVNAFTKLPDNFNRENSTSIGNGEYPKLVVEGQPIGSFFGFHYKGVYPSDEDAMARDADGNIYYDSKGNPIPMTYKGTYIFKGGDAKYEDINHDGKIDLNDVVYIGDSNPLLVGSFGANFRYKRWDFSFSFYSRVGYDIINMVAMRTEGMNTRNNQSKAVLSRWRVQGQDEEGLLPRAYLDNPANNLGSDRYVERGDFIRLNNIKFGYKLSQKLCDKLHLRSANISASARKLFTITNYSGQDPEVGQDASDPFWVGVDDAKTPPPKIITISLSVGF